MTTLLHQEAHCPKCRGAWDLTEKEFVKTGDTLVCRFGCGPFTADAATVSCCMEDLYGMVQLGLREG